MVAGRVRTENATVMAHMSDDTFALNCELQDVRGVDGVATPGAQEEKTYALDALLSQAASEMWRVC